VFYFYNVPGRVRIISEAIKRTPQVANEVRKGLTTLAGVCMLHINLITGSILIHYNPKTLASECGSPLSVQALPPIRGNRGGRKGHRSTLRKAAPEPRRNKGGQDGRDRSAENVYSMRLRVVY